MDVRVEINRVVRKSSEDVQDRMERVIYTGRGLEVQIN